MTDRNPNLKESDMNPIQEALDIVEKWMLAKDRPAGCGRLHRLLSRVRDEFFLEEEDAAELVEDAPFPAA
jgi:hypothetical protein